MLSSSELLSDEYRAGERHASRRGEGEGEREAATN